MQRILTEKMGTKQIVLLQQNVDVTDERLKRRINSSQRNGQEVYLWLDCSQVACLKSLGFCHFLNQVLLLRKMGVQVILLDLPAAQRHFFKVLHLEHLFTFVPDFEEAYQLLRASVV